jgi:hypothetical protein
MKSGRVSLHTALSMHVQLSPLHPPNYAEYLVPPPLTGLALAQFKERQIWLDSRRARKQLCAGLPQPHGVPGLPEPFSLAPEAIARVVINPEGANLEFWRQICVRLREVKDLVSVSDLVTILTALRDADFRDTALMGELVEEFIDDSHKLSPGGAAQVLELYAKFSVISDRLISRLSPLATPPGGEAQLQALLQGTPEKTSLAQLVALASPGDFDKFPGLKETLAKAKLERSVEAVARGVELGAEGLVGELIILMIESSTGRDKSWAPPELPAELPPLTPGPELPREFTQWSESPTLEELTAEPAAPEPAGDEYESIIFKEEKELLSEEPVRSGPENLLGFLRRRRSGADRVSKMSLQDLKDRNEIAQLGYTGFVTAHAVSNPGLKQKLVDLSVQLLTGSIGGLHTSQLLRCYADLEILSTPDPHIDSFFEGARFELTRRSALMSEEERERWKALKEL